jgi:hypothetical protein
LEISSVFSFADFTTPIILRGISPPSPFTISRWHISGYPIQPAWAANYQQKAAQGAKMAEISATTGGDKGALRVLTNEYHGVRDWSNQLVEASKSMNTAKYSMSPGALRDDPQSQKLITCWQFLGSMLSSGSFQDDSSCH